MSIFVNIPYSQQLTATGGNGGPYKFFLKDGTLPTGITLTTGGLLSGTPTVVGNFNFTVEAIDGENGYGERNYDLEVIGGNEWDDIASANGRSHYWPMNEASGTYIDQGDVGGIDMVGLNADTELRQAPGLGVRGSPRSYGFWQSNDHGQRPQFAGDVIPVVGHTTGAWGAWFIPTNVNAYGDTFPDDDIAIQSHWFANNQFGIFMNVQTDGRIVCRCQGVSRGIQKRTALNFFRPGQLYYVHFEQRADGTGLHMFINGVENTDEATIISGAGTTLDSWVEDIHTGFPHQGSSIAGRDALDASWKGVVSEPYGLINGTWGDAAILSAYNAALTGAQASDFHEFIQDLALKDGTLAYFDMWFGQNDVMNGIGIGDADGRGSAFTSGTSQENVLDNAGVISDYPSWKQVYGSSNPTVFDVANRNNLNVGGQRKRFTVAAFVTVNGVPDGDRKIIWTFGSSSTNSMELGVVGSVLGWQVFFRAFELGVETYRVLSGIIALGGSEFGMIGVVQPHDGGGPQIYWNDDNVSNTTPITTNPDISLENYGSVGMRWGGEQGSQTVDNWEPGELHRMIIMRKALTDAEMDAVYAAGTGNVSAVVRDNFDQYVATLSPIIDFRFDEASGNLINNGSGTGGDLPWVNGPTTREVANGDQSASGPGDAVSVTENPTDDLAGGLLSGLNIDNILQNELSNFGTFLGIFRTSELGAGNQSIFTFEDNSGFHQFRFEIDGSGNVRVSCFTNPSSQGWELVSTTGDFRDGEWHVVVVPQYRDGSVNMWIDGIIDDANHSGSIPNLWIPELYVGPPTKIGVGSTSTTAGTAGVAGYTGEIDRIMLLDEAITPLQVEILSSLYLG